MTGAFGLRERVRAPGPDGKIVHAEMDFAEDGVVLLGCPGSHYKNPRRLGQATQNLYVYVEDVDKHFAQAKRADAVILEELNDQDYGDRRYGAEDLEGHRWYFAQHMRDTP